MPSFPWGEDDDEALEYPDLPGLGDEDILAVSSPDPDDCPSD